MAAVIECVACNERFEVPEPHSPSPKHVSAKKVGKTDKDCVGAGMIGKVVNVTDRVESSDSAS